MAVIGLVSHIGVVAAISSIVYLLHLHLLNNPIEPNGSIFDFDVFNASDEVTNLSSFKGQKAYLIVNVASKCGANGMSCIRVHS